MTKIELDGTADAANATLAELIKKSPLSCKEIGEAINTTGAYVSAIQSGKETVKRLDQLCRLYAVLGYELRIVIRPH